jgi:hypothetical protein
MLEPIPSKEDYKMALIAQDACNLSGVVIAFREIISKVWNESLNEGKGTQYVNEHPLCILYADKIADLSRSKDFENYQKAYKECKRRAK